MLLLSLCLCCPGHVSLGRYDEPCIAVTSDAALSCSGVCCGKLAQGCLLPTWCLPALQLQGANLGCLSQWAVCLHLLLFLTPITRLACSTLWISLFFAWADLLSLLKVASFKWKTHLYFSHSVDNSRLF